MASTTSLTSVSFELSTPVAQLEAIISNSQNELLVKVATKIKTYLENGKKIEEAVAAIYYFYDAHFLFTITHRLDKKVQEEFRGDIKVLLGKLYGGQHPETLSKYEVAQIDVRAGLKTLGERMQVLVLATYDKIRSPSFTKIEDAKEMFS